MMLSDKVVDSSLIVLGVLQIYSMFLPDVTSIDEKTPEIIREEEIHASIAVVGLAAIACWLTKAWFPGYVAIGTGAAMLFMYEYALRRHCGCGEEE